MEKAASLLHIDELAKLPSVISLKAEDKIADCR